MKIAISQTKRLNRFGAFLAALLALSVTQPLWAKDAPDGKKEKALERLKKGEFQNLEQFEVAAKEANAAGVPAQTIVEARLIYCCTTDNPAPLPEVIKQLQAMLPTWKEPDSLFFRTSKQLEGLMTFGQALIAEQANDEAEFEKSIKEAFWRSPEAASLIRKKLEAHRSKARLANLVLPMNVSVPVSGGGQTTLAELVKGHKAVLLDFWASWCGPCMSLMTELKERAHKLAPLDIIVAGINTEAAAPSDLTKAKEKAETVKKSKKVDFAWLIEPADEPFSRLLEIESIPRAVLVSPEGKVLYNGHPSDPALIAALSKLGVQLAESK